MVRVIATFVAAVLLFLASPCSAEEGAALTDFKLNSSAFVDQGAIPVRYTCRGANVNPPFSIANIPVGTKSMALSVHDPDGLAGLWVHWVVFNIRPDIGSIGEHSAPGVEALNDFGNFYYGGPCPTDAREHHYVFTLYALSGYLADVTEGATLDTLQQAMTGKVIAKSELVGTYQDPEWLQK